MSLLKAFHNDVAAANLPAAPASSVITEADIAHLPNSVARYLDAMGVLGQPRVTSFVARFEGRFRRTAQESWMPCVAWQYNQAEPLTRVFTMHVQFLRIIPMIGHDTYIRGSGRMLGKVLGLITVADGSGESFDIGELVTYVNDAILLAPSMLLTSAVTWREVDETTFDVSLTDSGHTVTARVFLDERGLPRDFATTDRFLDADEGPIRCEWRTPIDSWDTSGARPHPGTARATWMTTEPLTYIEGHFVADSIQLNPLSGSVA